MSDVAICLFCHTEKVPLSRWNMRCPKCKAKQDEIDANEQINIRKRSPAARIVTEDGRTIWVDKFGKEVENPGYDLTNDPRGWQYTGTKKQERETIT